MGAILQTNLVAFVEAPERRVITSTTGRLDQMSCKYIGPSRLVDVTQSGVTTNYLPKRGAPHLTYPLMFCVSAEVSDMQGSLAEITANYAGRLNINGQSNFVSETLTEYNASEKEVTYTQIWSTLMQQINFNSTTSATTGTATGTGGTQGIIQIYKVGVGNFVRHYLTKDVTFKYCCRPAPAGPIFGGGSLVWTYDRFAGLSASSEVDGGSLNTYISYLESTSGPFGIVSNNRPTQFQAAQVIENWYEVSETWDFRYETP